MVIASISSYNGLLLLNVFYFFKGVPTIKIMVNGIDVPDISLTDFKLALRSISQWFIYLMSKKYPINLAPNLYMRQNKYSK